MDMDSARLAHPGFVEIIRNMSSDEAKTLKFLLNTGSAPVVDIKKVLTTSSGHMVMHELVSTIGTDAECEHGSLVASYLINLERLGLIQIVRTGYLTQTDAYDRIVNDVVVKGIIEELNKNSGKEYTSDIEKYYVKCTVFGKQFGSACVNSRDKT